MTNPYPWLTIGEDGSLGADLQGCTGMEMDRRIVIMQEIEAGRLVVADEAERWKVRAEASEADYRGAQAHVERLYARIELLQDKAHPMDHDSPAYD